MDLGVLLSVPLESIVVRAVLATLGAYLLVRLLLKVGLKSSYARVATGLAPVVALAAVIVATGASVNPPTLMLPGEGGRELLIPVSDGYLRFAPLPLLVGLWACVASWRLAYRGLALVRVRRQASSWASQSVVDERLSRISAEVADALAVPKPRLAVRKQCPGGAYVVGTRRPIVVVGTDLTDALDDQELEGVLAHELAHVKRRDTVMATAVGVLRDIAFFVPGGKWSVRQLHRERELAADQLAVSTTGRPGALASGLLKVIETGPARSPCAALVPSGGVVDRVKILVDQEPAATPTRRHGETVAVVSAVVFAVAAGLIVPSLAAGPDREREALAFVWSASQPVPTAEVPSGEARAFDVYRRSEMEIAAPDVTAATRIDEHSQENRRAAMHACEHGDCPVPSPDVGLGLQPPSINVDEVATDQWEPRQVGSGEAADGFRVFWLQRGETTQGTAATETPSDPREGAATQR